HVWIDLRRDVTGEEAEALTGLHGRTREDDAPDLPLGEGGDGERDGEVRLSGARRPDAERQRRAADRVPVMLLRDRLRGDALSAVGPDHVLEDVADVLRLIDRVQDRVDRPGPHLLPALDEVDELLDHSPRLGDLGIVAVERQPVATEVDRAAQSVAESLEHAVSDPG